MKRWKNVNTELKKLLNQEEFETSVHPYREEIQNIIKNSEVKEIKIVYREIRARLLEGVRINLALLDAAAHEEQLVKK